MTHRRPVAERPPGFTCTAVITTATRQKVVAVPIQATTVREMVVDDEGHDRQRRPSRGKRPPRREPAPASRSSSPGQTRKELEGVFVVQDGQGATSPPIKTGIAGEKYFEVLDGLKAGDEVITGPFASVRELRGRRRR